MPARDGTGRDGKGARTGRGEGDCESGSALDIKEISTKTIRKGEGQRHTNQRHTRQNK